MRKFEYTDIDGIKKEAETFTVSDFVVTPSPNSPVLTGPSGYIPPEMLPPMSLSSAVSLVITRECSEALLRGDIVRPTGGGRVGLADSSLTVIECNAIGICLTPGDVGDTVQILIMGVYKDASLDGLAENIPLFLEKEGAITDDTPSKPNLNFQVEIGKTLGAGEILVFIQRPISLGG